MNWVFPEGDTFFTEKFNPNTWGEDDWNIVKSKLTKFNTCLDIGAHCGLTSYRYSKYFNKVKSFEPVHYNYFTQNLIGIKNVELFSVGASDKIQKLTMYRSNNNSGATEIMSSKPTGSRWNPTPIYADFVPIDNYRFEDVDFIKIDTENFILPVLKGAINTIKKYNPILQIEFNSDDKNSKVLLESLGYTIFDKKEKDIFFIKET